MKNVRILVTGAKGFVGQNLIAELKNRDYVKVYEYDVDSEPSSLDQYCSQATFIFHLAGINRPEKQEDFMEGNFGFTSILLNTLKKHKNFCPILISSSIQAALDNPYGISKKAGEDLLFSYHKETGAKVLVYRFPNIFGKWCKPNYNSAIATFCHNIAHDLPITVNAPDVVMNLVYIDDVINELINALEGKENKVGTFCQVSVIYTATLGKIVDLIYSFKESRKTLNIANMGDDFEKKLYSTYLSYLPVNQFSYPLTINKDNRGSFTEILKTPDRGQVSVNISKPGITKGNHWHHTKNEKFLVVSGKGIIRFRSLNSDDVIEYHVSSEKLEVVDIPPGYTHNIENLGDADMVTIIWVSEVYTPEKPDTYYEEV